MALMDSVSKVTSKVVKLADDYKVRLRRSPRPSRLSPPLVARPPTLNRPRAHPRPLSRLIPQDYFHYGLIPAIIVVGMCTTPRPGITALLTPV